MKKLAVFFMALVLVLAGANLSTAQVVTSGPADQRRVDVGESLHCYGKQYTIPLLPGSRPLSADPIGPASNADQECPRFCQ